MRSTGAALLLVFLILTGIANFAGAQEIPPNPSETRAYLIQIGDVLEIGFFRTPELNQTRTVGPDGAIHLMLIGPVQAANRSVMDLTGEIEERYRSQLVDPAINVHVQDFAGLKVYLGGEINQPGVIPYKGGLTLVQALMNAGGFKETARLDEVLLIRQSTNRTPTGTVVNVKRILQAAEFGADPPLQPLDVIFVPRSRIANVNLFITQYIKNNLPIPFFLNLYGGN